MTVTKSVKISVWTKMWGTESAVGQCYVCGRPINNQDFVAGHIVAKANGGDESVDNLLPICSPCNGSMGKENLENYKAKHFPNVKVARALIKTLQNEETASRVKCPNCKGKGTLHALYCDEDTVSCPSCRKKGSVEASRADWVKCPKCKGYGKIDEGFLESSRCPKCKGAGIVPPRTNG